ncbi:unnamed protein product, partial [Meganyctiphanes norvegica]
MMHHIGGGGEDPQIRLSGGGGGHAMAAVAVGQGGSSGPHHPASGHPVSSPSLASSPPITTQTSPILHTSISHIPASSPVMHHLDKNTSLATKLRLSKFLDDQAYPLRASLYHPVQDDGNIRVLSPALVNSQVLPRTRPLSPDPLLPPPATPTDVTRPRSPRDKSVSRGGRKSQPSTTPEQSDGDGADKASAAGSAKGGRGRGRRRPRPFKLKFHHQALPQEYLDHYEAKLRQEQRQAIAQQPMQSLQPPQSPVTPMTPTPDSSGCIEPQGLQGGVPRRKGGKNGRSSRGARPITIHEAGGGATEALLRDLLMSRPHLQQAALHQVALARAQSVPSVMMATGGRYSPAGEDQLPYMGEMILDSKPRRGRKPKKQDITHLINKNYGGFGLGPSGMVDAVPAQTPPSPSQYSNPRLAALQAHLQQSLEQEESDREDTYSRHSGYSAMSAISGDMGSRSRSYTSLVHSTGMSQESESGQNEPLNLCVRDTPLKLENDNHSPIRPVTDIKLEPGSGHIVGEDAHGGLNSPDPALWAAANRLNMPPHWLQDYRLKNEDGLSSGQSTPSLCSQSSHLPSFSPPVFPQFSPPPPLSSPHRPLSSPHRLISPHSMASPHSPHRLISPHSMASPQSPHSPSPAPDGSSLPPNHHHHRHVHALLKESLQQRLEEAARERLTSQDLHRQHSENGRSSARGGSAGARRKRSALFIPPPDPNTEVSICKFKFTGGPNPMLEEKKMVSVDSGGNLRYFSGNHHGIIRDSKQAASHLRLSGKILENMSLSKCEKDVKKIRLESDNDDSCSLNGLGSATGSPRGTLERGMDPPSSVPPQEESPKRKRRSKKSSV